jgi:hypothetical protein
VDAGTTSVSGNFIFEAKALRELKTYEITRIEKASLQQSDLRIGTLSGLSDAKTIPIQIPFHSGSSVTVKITVVAKDMDGNTGDSTTDHSITQAEAGGGGNDPSFLPPSKGEIRHGEAMDPAATGVIRADERGAERFNVLQGIPTSESLYVNASTKSYLFQNEFANMTGTITYPIKVSRTYTLTWTDWIPGPPDANGNGTVIPVPRSTSQTVTKDYNVVRSYSYWVIDRLEVWTEMHRFERAQSYWHPWVTRAPLCEEPYISKTECFDMLKQIGIRAPRLYELGFPHNNCGGFCVNAGLAHFRLLLQTLPGRYIFHELQERELRKTLNKDISILRRKKDGKTIPLTLQQWRLEIQQASSRPLTPEEEE